ncbi:AMP-binding protein [Amycolatopsis sacchari]|uniref:AMP-binding protein n=1 Tax=Amycolatopsis sacchari TaxID=115433 RepID=UPI003D74E9AA
MVSQENPVTVAGLLRTRAQERPRHVGYTFLADGESQELDLTYGQADARARAVAAALRDAGARPGDRALLLLPPGLDYLTAFFGCLYAGVVAVPLYPPDPFQLDRSLPRIDAVVADCAPVAALTIAPLLGFLDELTSRAPRLGALRWLAVDEAPGADEGPVTADGESLAMLQYTSGSTSAPKGVQVSHANLLHNSARIQELFRTTPGSRGVSWLPPYHDMGLIGGLLQPLYAGASTVLMSPLHFLENPVRWLRAISRYRVGITGGPNFAYDLCARKADPAEITTWDLSCWEVAFNGAEPIRPGTLRRFAEVFAPAGFRAEAFLRCYGLAEATLIVSGAGGVFDRPAATTVRVDRAGLTHGEATEPGDVELTSCGRSLPDQRIAVVDPATETECPPGHVGEIWVSGPSVARGYWRRPEATGRTFHARLGEVEFLRTGDLGFVRDGELVVTGRLKDLIVVRGRNHYPQDLEFTAERAEPALRPGCSAAFAAGERVVLVHELRKQAGEADPAAVAARIRQAVAAEHGIQAHTVVLLRSGGMPKTSSGKVQRSLCRTLFLAGELPELSRSEPVAGGETTAGQVLSAPAEHRAEVLEDYLRTRLAAVSGVGDLDRGQPLTAAGLDSLSVLQLRQQVEAELGVSVPLRPLLTGASLADVAGELAGRLTVAAPAPAPAAEVTDSLSPGQRWIWFSQQFEPDSSAYTVAAALRILDPVDAVALRRALDAVVARHPALRATFPVREGEPVMLIGAEGAAAWQEYDASGLDDAALTARLVSAARRPFDLESGPLVRVALHRRPGGDVVLLAAHHIVTDFWSMTVLARDLAAYYTAYAGGRDLTLPAPAASYADFVAHQRRVLADEETVRYWEEQIDDGVAPLRLPGEGGAAVSFALPEELTARLHERAAAERVTLFVLLLSAFQAVLHAESGARDLAVGTSVAARTRPEFAEVVGCCMNPVLIRSRLAGETSFRELLAATRDRVAGALEHQEYPMTLLAARQRARGHGASLYEALFTFNRSPVPGDDLAALAAVGPSGVARRLGPLQVENFPLPQPESSLPVELVMAEAGGALRGFLRHRAGAPGLSERYVAMLEAVVADPDLPVAQPAPGIMHAG